MGFIEEIQGSPARDTCLAANYRARRAYTIPLNYMI